MPAFAPPIRRCGRSFWRRRRFLRRVFDAVREYLSGAISGLIFLMRRTDEGVENQGEDALHLVEIEDELSTKAEQCPLFGPVGRQVCGQSHELLGIELWWLPTVDDSGGDVGREPGEAEQGVDVSGRDPFIAGDVVNSECRVLSKASLDAVSASDDPQEAHIDRSAVTGIIDQHFHLAADALELGRRHQGHDLIG